MKPRPVSIGLMIVLTTASLSLAFLPRPLTEKLRRTVRDAAGPGAWGLAIITAQGHALLESTRGWMATREQVAQLQTALEESEQRRRELETQLLLTRDQTAREFASSTESAPLLIPELVGARVIGTETAAIWKGHTFLAGGTQDGVEESLLVVANEGALLDVGETDNLATGQPVYAGRIVVGRIAQVGRWTSALQPVTDREFRGHARILRETDAGLLPGPEGILEGDGSDRMSMKFVESTKSVSIGDVVYTAGDDGVLTQPMLYGQVVYAELPPGAPHWDIQVIPAHQGPLQKVQVLRTRLNPLRGIAN